MLLYCIDDILQYYNDRDYLTDDIFKCLNAFYMSIQCKNPQLKRCLKSLNCCVNKEVKPLGIAPLVPSPLFIGMYPYYDYGGGVLQNEYWI
jgi:hypothetical protein